MDTPDGKTGYLGYQAPTSSGSEHNSERLHIEGVHDERRTNVIVQVQKVYGGGEGAAPTADVSMMVHQVDGLGNPTPHATIYNVPVGRAHSGAGAIISDPMPGDTYMMAVADRDISRLKASGTASAPDSRRRGSLSDGMLLHAMLSKAPKQFVRFKPEGGVRIVDSAGGTIETFTDGRMSLTPMTGGSVILGGTGSDGGTYSPVQTVAGPSSIVKAKI